MSSVWCGADLMTSL